jgi:hypothetical protein
MDCEMDLALELGIALEMASVLMEMASGMLSKITLINWASLF